MRVLAIVLSLMTVGCASTPEIRTDFDRSVNYSKFRSYSWIYNTVPAGMNPLMYNRVRSSIDRSLQARGFIPSQAGDFAVAFTIGARDRVQVTDFGPYAPHYPGYGLGGRVGWVPAYRSVDIRNVTEGTLAVDIFDATSRQPIWHAVASGEVTRKAVEQAQIDRTVDALIRQFPPTP